MSKLVSSLYKIARAANDVHAVLNPRRLGTRIKNKIVGRVLSGVGFWKKLWK